ncbi:MAG: hypothetical protein IAE89_00560 [Anaerolineae bacterium]|nr:hypothetical protein [Anaerolineae bacterium]
MTPSSNFSNMLVVSPGNLIYYLAVFAISLAALFMSLGIRKRGRVGQIYTTATVGTVIAWTLLMLSALFSLVSNTSPDAILPPIDRLVQTLVILLLGWAFLTADHERFGRAGPALLLILMAWAAIGYIVTGIEWASAYSTQDFNSFTYGSTWTLIPLLACLFGGGICLVFFRKIKDAPLKLVFFGVLIIGYAGTLMTTSQGTLEGDYSGIQRIAFLAAMLLTLGIIYRQVLDTFEMPAQKDAQNPISQQSRPVATIPDASTLQPLPIVPPVVSERESAQLMKALGIMLEKASPDAIPERIVQATLNTLKAEIGALLSLQDSSYAEIFVGYDRTMNRSIKAISVNMERQPTLQNAVERRLQRPLFPDRNAEELPDLYSRLDIESVGPTYFQPLVSDGELLAILMVGLPYTARELTDQEQELLKGIGIIAANLLGLSFSAKKARMNAESRTIEAMMAGRPVEELGDDSALTLWNEMRGELTAAHDQIGQLQGHVTSLKIQLDDERSRLAKSLGDTQESLSISQRIVTLNQAHQKLIDERDQLATRLREVEAAISSTPGNETTDVLRSLIDVLRREKDDLNGQRDRLRAELNELRRSSGDWMPESVNEMVERMGEEKAVAERQRDELNEKLNELETRLSLMGIAVVAGSTPDEVVQRETDREKIIQALQSEVANIAADREAVNKQKDRLRSERDELLRRQEEMRSVQARVLAENAAYEQELTEAHADLQDVRRELQTLADQKSTLTQDRDRLTAERQALETDRDQLMARIEGDRSRLQQLGVDGVGALTRMIEELTAQRGTVERELNETKSQLAAVEDKLQVVEIRAASLQPQVVYRPDNPDALVGMVQELRTPMTSIVGYVDLLLNESAGILGEMQRKFLQRVSANVHRLSTMMEDLIELSYLDAGKVSLKPEAIDLIEVLEDAITNASAPLREKGLTVHLQLDDDAPLVCADREAMTKIIGQLLTNAYLASPPGTEIFVSARRETLSRQVSGVTQSYDVLHISFEDRGGGITLEDQPRVFARKYKAENPLIQGLGDTGVGMAIAKALIEAQNGEIWVDSQPGAGASFNFVLPAEIDTVLEP